MDRLGALVGRLSLDGQDLTILLSLGLVSGGCWMIYRPAALIAPGVLLFVLATWPIFQLGRRAE